WLTTLVAAVFLLGLNLAVGNRLLGLPPQTYLVFLAVALISQITGYFALSYALGHLPASVVAPTMISQPVLTALLAIPLAGEALSISQWIGGAAVLAGIYIVNRVRG
ncbi:MAG: EamA family transporter, partial [Anaerolineaceae bacterium]